MYDVEDDQADDAIYSTYLVHTDREVYTLYGGQVFIDQRVILALQGSLLQLM